MATSGFTSNKTIKIGASYDPSLFVLGDTINDVNVELIPKINEISLPSLTKQTLPINFKIFVIEKNTAFSWTGTSWAELASAVSGSLQSRGSDETLVNVDISGSKTPTVGQVLTAISNTEAKWMDASGGTVTEEQLQQIYDEIARIFTLINSIVPSLNYVGEFDHEPTQAELGDAWKQNALYKNILDGKSYILTGDPLHWVVYISDGYAFTLVIESSNGTAFKYEQQKTTTLKARLFKNGAEITEITPASWFSWRRVSAVLPPPPGTVDDATWNSQYSTGYPSIIINVDDVYCRATFFCDIKV